MLAPLNYNFVISFILISTILIFFADQAYPMRASGRSIYNEPGRTVLIYGDAGYGLPKVGRKVETQKYFVPTYLMNNDLQPFYRRRYNY
ncbi:hypothetical protein ACQ4LE_007050 [Meloidogyne hapla]